MAWVLTLGSLEVPILRLFIFCTLFTSVYWRIAVVFEIMSVVFMLS